MPHQMFYKSIKSLLRNDSLRALLGISQKVNKEKIRIATYIKKLFINCVPIRILLVSYLPSYCMFCHFYISYYNNSKLNLNDTHHMEATLK